MVRHVATKKTPKLKELLLSLNSHTAIISYNLSWQNAPRSSPLAKGGYKIGISAEIMLWLIKCASRPPEFHYHFERATVAGAR